MKKKLTSLAIALVMCLSIVTPALAYGPPIDVYIDESEVAPITVKVGDKGKLTGYSVSSDQDVKWTSSDNSGLSVDKTSGAYTALRSGTFTLTATLADGSGIPASITIIVAGAVKPAGITATPSATNLVVNGKKVEVDSYQIDGSNYIKLRDLATMVDATTKNFNVLWDGAKNAINLKSIAVYAPVGGEMAKGDGKSKTAKITTSAIYVDEVKTPLSAYLIGDSNYFKLRDIMKTFDIFVGWDAATQTATLETAKSYVNP